MAFRLLLSPLSSRGMRLNCPEMQMPSLGTAFPPLQYPDTSSVSLLWHFSAEWELPASRRGTWHQLLYNPTAGEAMEMLQYSFRTTELNRHRQEIQRYRHSRSIRQKAASEPKFKKPLILLILQQILSIVFLSICSSNISNGQMNYANGESTTSITSTM